MPVPLPPDPAFPLVSTTWGWIVPPSEADGDGEPSVVVDDLLAIATSKRNGRTGAGKVDDGTPLRWK